MEGLVIEVWEGSKEANNGWHSTPGLATVGAMAAPQSERTSVGSGQWGQKRELELSKKVI